jgi:hypothetical protein
MFGALIRNRTVVSGLYCLTAAFIFLMWIWGAETSQTSINGDARSTLSDILQGTAHKPYVERVLIPILTNTVYKIIPKSVSSNISSSLLSSSKYQKESTRLGWDNDFIPQYIIALAWAFLALAAFPFVMRSLVVELYDVSAEVCNVLPIAALLVLPVFFHTGTHYIYDFPALLFFTTGLLLVLKRKWFLFYAVFCAGCLNKETMVFLLLVILLFNWRTMDRRVLSIHLISLLLIFIIIKTSLTFYFSGNPGSAVEFHLFANIHKLLMPYTLLHIFVAGIILYLLIKDHSKKPQFLRQSLWLFLPFALTVFVFACIDEIRDLYEIFPICFLLMSHTLLFSILKIPYQLRSK